MSKYLKSGWEQARQEEEDEARQAWSGDEDEEENGGKSTSGEANGEGEDGQGSVAASSRRGSSVAALEKDVGKLSVNGDGDSGGGKT